jgi:hypothetical protein
MRMTIRLSQTTRPPIRPTPPPRPPGADVSIAKQAKNLKPGDIIKHPNGSRSTITSVVANDDLIEIDFAKDNLCHAEPTENVEVIGVLLSPGFLGHVEDNLISYDKIPDNAWGYAPSHGRKNASISIRAGSPTEAYLRALSIEQRFAEAFPWFDFSPIIHKEVEPMEEGLWRLEVERW